MMQSAGLNHSTFGDHMILMGSYSLVLRPSLNVSHDFSHETLKNMGRPGYEVMVATV